MNTYPTALSLFEAEDLMRQAQGNVLSLLGFGPRECAYDVVASAASWRLRDYGGTRTGPPVLIVAAPIKRPYIWDLAPPISPIRYLRYRGLHVYLLEWIPPRRGDAAAGLEVYADRAIADCVTRIAAANGTAPCLIGHSLGGTLAAIYAALDSGRIRGLVLLGAPLCFQPRSSEFRDAIGGLAPLLPMDADIVPGSVVSHLSAMASPRTFIWSRIIDETLSVLDPQAAEIVMQIERWALDEVALPGLLLRQVVRWLYQENHLCRGSLRLRGRNIGPGGVRVPVLAVINTADAIAPPASVQPFLLGILEQDVRLVEFAGEAGVGLQHVALVAGRQAHAEVWPTVAEWIEKIAI